VGGPTRRHVSRRRAHKRHTAASMPHTKQQQPQQQQLPPTQTHLLQLKLSPPSDVGISVEGRSDATSNGGGIHCGQAVGPTIAFTAFRGDGRFGMEEMAGSQRGVRGRVCCRGVRVQKKFGPKSGCRAGRQGPRNGGAEVSVGSGCFCLVHAVSPLSEQPAAQPAQRQGGPEQRPQAWPDFQTAVTR
jgi:hypothetical protein